jgi:hypothetical protein
LLSRRSCGRRSPRDLKTRITDYLKRHPAKQPGDVQDTLRDGLLCGMTADQIFDAPQYSAPIVEHNIARPEVWRAILAVAERVKPGALNGPHVARIGKNTDSSGHRGSCCDALSLRDWRTAPGRSRGAA